MNVALLQDLAGMVHMWVICTSFSSPCIETRKPLDYFKQLDQDSDGRLTLDDTWKQWVYSAFFSFHHSFTMGLDIKGLNFYKDVITGT